MLEKRNNAQGAFLLLCGQVVRRQPDEAGPDCGLRIAVDAPQNNHDRQIRQQPDAKMRRGTAEHGGADHQPWICAVRQQGVDRHPDGIRDISGGDRQPHRVLRDAEVGQQIDHAGAQVRAADLAEKYKMPDKMTSFQCFFFNALILLLISFKIVTQAFLEKQ